MAQRRTKVFFDAGCRPNPGAIEVAVVMRGTTHLFDQLGEGTNSDAEWLGLLCALELEQAQGAKNVELIGDALEVIRQANAALGGAPCGPAHPQRQHILRFMALARQARPARIRWVKRAQNLAGIALAARHPR